MKTKYFLLFLVFGSALHSEAQDAFSAAGGDIGGGGGSEAFSVGLVVYTELTGVDGSASQGIQYAYEMFLVAVDEIKAETAVRVFPNPASDQLFITSENTNAATISYGLVDIQGRLLATGSITASQTELNVGALPGGIYVLRIIQNHHTIQSFKIIKK